MTYIISLAQDYEVNNEEDKVIIDEIIDSLKINNKLPFSYTPQENTYLREHSKNKWIKYLIYRFKFRIYPIRKIVSSFPTYILIEPTSACNLKCTMCFQMDKTFSGKKNYMGTMDLELFKEIVDQAEEGGTQAITLGSRGEPLMNKKIVQMIDYLKGKFIETKIVTNATKLTPEISHAILRNKINIIVYSIDSEKKEIYEKIRVNANFEQVLNNIKNFNIICKEYPDSTIQKRISGVKVDDIQNKDNFYSFWNKYVDQVSMKDAFERWNTYENPIDKENNTPCYIPFERMYVWYDGICNPCDSDYKSYFSMGNVKERTIKEIWHGEPITTLRRNHLNNKRCTHVPCDRCGVS
jgi:radical SAM protein with 4Fe4S-binding SPASM domain